MRWVCPNGKNDLAEPFMAAFRAWRNDQEAAGNKVTLAAFGRFIQ